MRKIIIEGDPHGVGGNMLHENGTKIASFQWWTPTDEELHTAALDIANFIDGEILHKLLQNEKI